MPSGEVLIVMVFDTNKQKGNAGLAMAIAYFGSNGYIVSLPLNDTQDYDMIVDKDGILQKVQCKSTNQKKENGNYELALSSCGGTKGEVYKTVIDTDVDLIFALRGDGVMYVIPKKDITAKRKIVLCTEKNKFANNDTIDTSKYIVTL